MPDSSPSESMDALRRTSHLSGGNVAYIEGLYEQYLENPADVSPEWRDYFDRLPRNRDSLLADVPHAPVRAHFELLGRHRHRVRATPTVDMAGEHERKQVRVLELISAYRHRGHKRARLDPLGMMERPPAPQLALAYHRLSEADRDTVFQTGSFFYGASHATLGEIRNALEATYCGPIGAEFMHIVDPEEQLWVQQRLESVRANPQYTTEQKRTVLERLTAAEGLERYLQSRYPGTKRFGLEGAESLIPMLHELLQRAGQHGIVEAVIGMAHRGRLNVLVKILGKHPRELFDEFEGKHAVASGSGDVKYHQGFSSNMMTPGGEMHVALSFNPSHLEIVSPVVEGSVRARQDRRGDDNRRQVIPITIHGDAAFAGQGVVMETLQMSQTRGFNTGGTVHIIINNQVGFTTHRQEDARSTEYCTEVAKMIQAPIFHVNGDSPEAVLFVTQVAIDYRMQFGKDIVIDLVCYRRRGHNEAEEPAKTQPLMYQRIAELATTRALYADRMIAEGIIDSAEIERMADAYRATLESGQHAALSIMTEPSAALFVDWRPYLGHSPRSTVDTRVPLPTLQTLARQISRTPDGFALHPQLLRLRAEREQMIAGTLPINWGFAETLAYASLLDEHYRVRLVGQDTGVGTFSHRHAVLHSQADGAEYVPLKTLGRGVFDVFDSLLSEAAVLAFEYGYATTAPNALVIWEAQFGDFANGAQVVIDQFIASGEHKWGRLCGLVLLLPHGYEGQGPEHSSARLERFLQLSAEYNIQVCVPTTPAQVFHMLRRQMVRPLRKPLVVMTPKSLLRHKLAVSALTALSEGEFHLVLPELDALEPKQVHRLVLCSGKVYFDLLEQRRADARNDIAIVRLEQLYPFPEGELAKEIAAYPALTEVIWCQEEPMNQGAWYSSQHHMRKVVLQHNKDLYLSYAGRDPSAAAAAGYMSLHASQQELLVKEALYG